MVFSVTKPTAGMILSFLISPQAMHFSVILPSLSVVAFVTVVSYVWEIFSSYSVLVPPHTVQVYSFSPFCVQVGV